MPSKVVKTNWGEVDDIPSSVISTEDGEVREVYQWYIIDIDDY